MLLLLTYAAILGFILTRATFNTTLSNNFVSRKKLFKKIVEIDCMLHHFNSARINFFIFFIICTYLIFFNCGLLK
jgi:hypothetical protein